MDNISGLYYTPEDLLEPNSNSAIDPKRYWEFFLAVKRDFPNYSNKKIPINSLADDGAGEDINSKIVSLISENRKALHGLNS